MTTPAELLASASPRDRARGADLVRNRTQRGGMSREDALRTPVGKRGGNHASPEVMSQARRREDGSFAEIAADLGMTREGVRKIEVRALAKLRAALERQGLEAGDVLAWLSRRGGDPNEHPTQPNSTYGYGRRETETKTGPLVTDRERRALAACQLERDLDAWERDMRATVEARRHIERVVCGMEEGGHVRVLEERAEEGA